MSIRNGRYTTWNADLYRLMWFYLSFVDVFFPLDECPFPWPEPSSASAAHYGTQRFAAACTPALSSAQKIN